MGEVYRHFKRYSHASGHTKFVTVVPEWIKNLGFYSVRNRTVAAYLDDGVLYVMGLMFREKNTEKSRFLELLPVPAGEQVFYDNALRKLFISRRDPFDMLVDDVKFWHKN